MYYSVKAKWLQPKEGTDEMQKFTKGFLVYAESVTEAEARFIDWVPSNYQDAVVESVTKTTVGEIRKNGDSETFWIVKVMDDMDGRDAKPKAYNVVYNDDSIEAVVKKLAKDWMGADIDEVKKFKQIVDEDLIADDVPAGFKRQVVAKEIADDEVEG